MNCNSASLAMILYFVKSILNIIMIISPILAIISFIVALVFSFKNPDDINNIKKVKNIGVALVIIFFIPVIVDVSMSLLGDNYQFSSCWKKVKKPIFSTDYVDDSKRKPIVKDSSSYEGGKDDGSVEVLTDVSVGEKIARFAAQISGYATGNVSTGGEHWPGWYPNSGNIYLTKDTGGSGDYPNIGIGIADYRELPNDLENLHDFWFVQDMTGRYPYTMNLYKTYWGKSFAYAGMWPAIFSVYRATYDPLFNHSKSYLDSAEKNGSFVKLTTTFGSLDSVAKPGDFIGSPNMGHCWIWIGNNIVKDYWKNVPSTAKMLTASGQEGRWPNIVNSHYGTWKGNIKATIYRPTGKVSISSSAPLVIDLTKYGLENSEGFSREESIKRQQYCDSHWPHLEHK